MRRLCIVGPMLEASGYAKTQGEVLADALERAGYWVARKSKYPNRIFRFFDTVFFLLLRPRQYDVAIVQVYGGLSFILEDVASWIAALKKKRIIMTLHGGALPEFMSKRPKWSKRVVNRAHVCTCPSDYLIDQLAFLGQPMLGIGNIIQLGDYPFSSRRVFRPRLLWMRAYHDLYNPHLALDVFESLRRSYPNATLTMAGPDMGLKSEIINRVRRAGYGAQVTVLDLIGLDEKRALADSHDIYINTNRVDNTPVSMIEMAALGLAIVSTCVGGIPYLMTSNVNALLAGEDVEELTACIVRIVEQPDLGSCLTKNARELIGKFDERMVISEWTKLME